MEKEKLHAQIKKDNIYLDELSKKLDATATDLETTLKKYPGSDEKRESFLYDIIFKMTNIDKISKLIIDFALEGNDGNGKKDSSKK